MSSLAAVTGPRPPHRPDPLGSPHALLGFGVAHRRRDPGPAVHRSSAGDLYTAIVTSQPGDGDGGLARMVSVTGAVTLFSCVPLVSVMTYHSAPALSRRLAGIRLPVFPSATSRWVFEARPDLPTTVVRSDRRRPPGPRGPRLGPRCVAPGGAGPLVPVRLADGARRIDGRLPDRACPIRTPQTAGSRSSWPDSQRGLPDVARPLLRGPLAGDHPGRNGGADRRRGRVALLAGAVSPRWRSRSEPAILVLLPAAGLTSAAAVPNTVYSPLFRKFVEWIEYLCLMPIFPLALWLMNVYAAIRYR